MESIMEKILLFVFALSQISLSAMSSLEDNLRALAISKQGRPVRETTLSEHLLYGLQGNVTPVVNKLGEEIGGVIANAVPVRYGIFALVSAKPETHIFLIEHVYQTHSAQIADKKGETAFLEGCLTERDAVVLTWKNTIDSQGSKICMSEISLEDIRMGNLIDLDANSVEFYEESH